MSDFSTVAKPGKPLRLDQLNQDCSIQAGTYKSNLRENQLKLLQLQRRLMDSKRTLVMVVEGPDAAGKGGAIRRTVERLDPRTIRVYSIVAPTEEEHRHHYLWRFWSKLPPHGQMAIFDRSWYGRVLVERVEGFATNAEWRRAYQEINEFERLLYDDGAVIVKVYLHISKDEQLLRFRRRAADPMKHWKINDEDWRNRAKWDKHNKAAEEMFERTSTAYAPWLVVPANYKWFARVKMIQTVLDRLEKLKF